MIGCVLVPLSVYFGNFAYVVVQALLWGQTSMLRGPVVVLFALSLVNLLARRLSRRVCLEASELLIVYSMVSVASCISGFGMIQWLVNILPALTHYDTPTNRYDRFACFVAPWLTPHNPVVIEDYFHGNSTMYRADVLSDWARPVMAWSVFLMAMTWVTLCLCAIIRKQWISAERISFPLVYLPLEMAKAASGDSGLFRNRLMWAGFAIAGLLESIDYINFMYPAMPYIQLKPVHWETFLTLPPWNSVGVLTTAFYPFVIGIAYLISTEASFSCWFFYLLMKTEKVAAAHMGVVGTNQSGMSSPPFIGEQGVGAFLALGLMLVYRSRREIGRAIQCLWDKEAAAERVDHASIMSPKVAVWGALAGIALLCSFLVAIGIPAWAACLFWVVYFLILVVLTRIVSVVGAGWAWGPTIPVHGALYESFGMTAFSPKAITAFGYMNWFDAEFRDSPMPQELAAMKLREETGARPARLLWALVAATLLGILSAWWGYLRMYYEYGAGTAKVRPGLMSVGPGIMGYISWCLNSPVGPDTHGVWAMGAGAAIMVALNAAQQAFVWWPLHPIGYALSATQSMDYMWCPFFVGWLIKTLVLRYLGIRICMTWMAFFLGLILGDYVVPTVWGLWGMAAHTQVYMAFPH